MAERDRARQSAVRRERQRDVALAERDQARRDFAALEQERDAVVVERDQARQVSLALEQTRDAATRERDQARQAQARAEQQRDALVEDLRVTRNSLAQSRAETESAQRMNDPLQADVRRVNALLVAHAEELQRETARIRELETTAATASTARVVAEAETARAQANELQAVSRSGQYRTGWLAMRRRLLQQSDAAGAHIRRLSVRVADLADERDLAVRERGERAMAWRRMLRDARRSRELAQRVRDDLAGKLASSVSSVGGTIDTAGLIRRLEATYAAEANAAVPLPPADPAGATPMAVSVASPPAVVAGPSALAPSSDTVPSSSDSTQQPSSSVCTPAPLQVPVSSSAPSLSGTRRPRPSGARPSGSRHPSSSCVGLPATSTSSSSPRRRSQRASTRADTAASNSAAAQASPVTSLSAAAVAAAAARARADASLFGSESSETKTPSFAKPFFPLAFFAAFTFSIDFASALPSGFDVAFGVAFPLGFAFIVEFLVALICPRAPVPKPANWNRALVTRANVDALYATRPWRYLAQEVGSVLFASGDAAFQPFMRRLRHHVERWAQAYGESTHELHVPGAAWRSWRSSRNSRRSHAGDHLNSLLQLVVDLFRRGLADMDLHLDPAVLHFPPAHSRIGRWFPGIQHTTLQEALDDVDVQEPWRRFHRTPLTVAQMDANVRCRVTRAHHAYLVPRLAGKFVQQVCA
ncbi:hypothetical protein PHYSODRAFT_251488 [Phytophthora sojae]|uniref:Uncharacterized protein n=1 Tax=Phytophthora sojae (strain P6497) TaxID=1094619 RepID=G5AEX9_PHYSP|nr:hypothetical protein PHYSODRAFT_251488 [Phytophthora sojae]EGZ05769.1 hypothetical protein PHYSODRAFT_251488 [Phytophthora sojae]|eukprot:XP_009538630.1 hypothetical protein PHYSODRAFT_251488 [Phytophthora sojae]